MQGRLGTGSLLPGAWRPQKYHCGETCGASSPDEVRSSFSKQIITPLDSRSPYRNSYYTVTSTIQITREEMHRYLPRLISSVCVGSDVALCDDTTVVPGKINTTVVPGEIN
jgi:hypothetical protein